MPSPAPDVEAAMHSYESQPPSHPDPSMALVEDAAKQATVNFEAKYPFLVLSVDGTMASMAGVGASHMIGRSVLIFQNLGEHPVDILWAAQAAARGRTVCIRTSINNAAGAKVQFHAEFCLTGQVLKMTATENNDLHLPCCKLSARSWYSLSQSSATSTDSGRNSPDIELMLTAEESAEADFDNACIDVAADSIRTKKTDCSF